MLTSFRDLRSDFNTDDLDDDLTENTDNTQEDLEPLFYFDQDPEEPGKVEPPSSRKKIIKVIKRVLKKVIKTCRVIRKTLITVKNKIIRYYKDRGDRDQEYVELDQDRNRDQDRDIRL